MDYPSPQKSHQLPAADSTLWQRIKLGDEQAMADVYDQHSKQIYRVALYLLHDTAGAEDVVQDVLLQFWRAPDAFDPARGSLGTWLTVVSRRKAIDRLRKRRLENADKDVAEVVLSISATQLDAASLNQITDKVRAVLNAMPAKVRATFELAFGQGLTHSEISKRLGEPLGTIKSRIRQGVNFIRNKLDSKDTDAK